MGLVRKLLITQPRKVEKNEVNIKNKKNKKLKFRAAYLKNGTILQANFSADLNP